jgi:hypothetical protein
VLEEAEEDLDQPTTLINKANDLGGNVEQVGGNAQQPVAAWPGGAAALPRLSCGVVLMNTKRSGCCGRSSP